MKLKPEDIARTFRRCLEDENTTEAGCYTTLPSFTQQPMPGHSNNDKFNMQHHINTIHRDVLLDDDNHVSYQLAIIKINPNWSLYNKGKQSRNIDKSKNNIYIKMIIKLILYQS